MGKEEQSRYLYCIVVTTTLCVVLTALAAFFPEVNSLNGHKSRSCSANSYNFLLVLDFLSPNVLHV